MSRFNLIDEKWIPVRFPDRTRGELGIRETLLLAESIAAIEDPSPLVVASLHRFLLAILYRALEGPIDIEQAKQLFRDGLPVDRITAYLVKWRDRFWLFDEKYPFGQNPNVAKTQIEPWTKLTAEYNATSNKVLFDHTSTKEPGTRDPKECARWLVSTMTFSISGGRGYYPSPSPNAMMCIPVGRNLQETLNYCLVPYPNREIMLMDSAVWEREPKSLPLVNPKRVFTGYADLFTWQSRMVLLEESPTGGVSLMRFVAGEGFDNPLKHPDPMQPYKTDKTHGRLPIQFREDRATWRDFDSLLPDQDGCAPLSLQNAVRLSGGKTANMPDSVLVLGLRYDPPNANLDFWRMERFVLPSALTSQRLVRSDIRRFLDAAEDAQKQLWSACFTYARDLLSRGERMPDKRDVRGFISQMNCIPWYWVTLEVSFHEILQHYALEKDPDEIELQWLQAVCFALKDAWAQHQASVSMGDAWAIRAVVKAGAPVGRKLKELGNKIDEFKGSLKEEGA